MALDYIDFANQQRPTVDLGGIIAKALQMRQQTDAAAQDKQLNDLRMQGEQMKLADLMRKQKLNEDARSAYANAPRSLRNIANPEYVSPDQYQNAVTAGPPVQQDAILSELMGIAPGKNALVYPGDGADVMEGYKPVPETITQQGEPDRFGAMADVYARGGDLESAKNIMSIQDQLAQMKAKVEATGGDLTAYHKAQLSADTYSDFVKKIAPMLKTTGGKAAAEGIAKAYQKMHPEDATLYDISNWQVTPAGVANPVHDAQGNLIGHMVTDSMGKDTFHKVEKDSKGFDTIDMGDRVKIVPRDGSAAYFEKKGITPGAAARITINQGGGDAEDVQAWAKAVKEGRATLQDVPNRGTVRSRVVKALEQQGGVDYAANAAENKANAGSIAQQQKQLGAMGSFVKNLDAQVNKVEKLSKELSTFDTRLLNVPLRAVRGQIAGSPQQAKYDMYLTEIESEIGKLATGSSASAAELSIGAQQKWAKIHDKNLSIKDMLELLKETKEAGKMRMQSVKDQLAETKAQMRNRGGTASPTAKDPLGIL